VPGGAPVVELSALYDRVAELAKGDAGVMHLTAGVFSTLGALVPDPQGDADWGGDAHQARCSAWALQRMCAVWDRRLEGKPCRHCGGHEQDELMVVCDRCESPYHRECQDGVAPVTEGPWYCGQCRNWLLLNGWSDVVEDLPLIDFLFRGRVPDDEAEYSRVQRLGETYRAQGEELETLVYPYGMPLLARWVPVPPLPMRAQLICDTHEALGHAGIRKLSDALLARWHWKGLRTDVARELGKCPVCQPERLGPEVWGPMLDVDRPLRPFMGWSIDLMGPLPPDERGCRYLAVAVDVFSKWVEATPITDKRAFTTGDWLYTTVLCRWGRPAFLRLDHGAEWEGVFR